MPISVPPPTPSAHLLRAIAAIAVFGPTTGCDAPPLEDLDDVSRDHREATHEPSNAARVVFESRLTVDEDGVPTSFDDFGEADGELWRRAARPEHYLHEGVRYIESASLVYTEGEGTQRAYAISTIEEELPSDFGTTQPVASPAASHALEQQIREHADDTISLELKLRGLASGSLPLIPPAHTLAPGDLERYRALRKERARRDRADALVRSRPLSDAVASLGGRVDQVLPQSGWVLVTVPTRAALVLLELPEVEKAEVSEAPQSTGWRQGAGRNSARLNANQFWDFNHNGEQSNPSRHDAGDILYAVIEATGAGSPPGTVGGFEDEACAFADVDVCTAPRIERRFLCDAQVAGNVCRFVSDFATSEEGFHGTAVAATILGDYTDGQGDGFELGDSSWTSGAHAPLWEEQASGMAPEASMAYMALVRGVNGGLADAVDDAIDVGADIINMSLGDSGSCGVEASGAVDEELELAFDDGIFISVSAGNNFGPSVSSCNVNGYAALPKTFAVNAFDADPAGCTSNPSFGCLVDQQYSSRGGAHLTVDGVVRAQAARVIDLVGPNNYYMATSDAGPRGEVGATVVGTSFSAPTIAGLAGLVKDWLLSEGQGWINSPGYLHTMMLLMGDRHYSTDADNLAVLTQQRDTSGSVYYGLGRAKLRLLEGPAIGSFALEVVSVPFTGSSQPFEFVIGNGPMPNATEMVKCVAFQQEDMSSKSDVSHVELDVEIQNAQSGQCTGSGTTVFSREDDSYDIKKMVAITDDDVSLGGRCVNVVVDPEHITNQGVTTKVACYYTGVMDDE